MKIEFVRASEKDAKKFVEIQDKAFNSDYIKYEYVLDMEEILKALQNQ